MKALIASFKMLLMHISRDGMLLVLCCAPILMLITMCYIVPTFVAPLLPFNISEYYLLIDLAIAVMVPYLFCFVSSLAILEEIDGNIAPYLSVTPIGKSGYLISRLLLPTLISALATMLFLGVWSLTELSWPMVILISLSVAILAMIGSMLVISFAKNKVEGIALSKVSGILMIGLFIPFFMNGNIWYIFGFLPSFWIAQLVLSANYICLLPLIVCSFIWIFLLLRIYKRRLL